MAGPPLPNPSAPTGVTEGTVEASFRSAAEALGLAQQSGIAAQLEDLAESLADAFLAGRQILIAGNGGSLADAMHFAEELTGRFRQDRPALPAIALADPTHLTCVANDYGFEQVFSRAVEAYGRPGDHLILLTTSGNSANLLKAAEVASNRGLHTVAFVGRGGGALADLCQIVVHFPGEGSDRIQEVQMLALHALVESIEVRLAPHWKVFRT
jgi:D-sedoheptulose 7-phosphate isomerase